MRAANEAPLCAVVGCSRPRESRGWCGTHYMRWRKHGDPGPAAIRVRRYDGPCEVDGCATRARQWGLCGMHAVRVARHGSPGGAEKQHAVNYEGMTCSVGQCGRRPKARGLCMPHYKRWRRWGDPTATRPVVPVEERFRRNVSAGPAPENRPGLGPCLLWTAGKTKQGYGGFHPSKGETVLAHRWAYINAGGSIEADQVLDHLCRVRTCVNPAHLEPVTNEENLRRGAGYGLRNGMRNSCINGHLYTPENTYLDPSGGVRCRDCARVRDRTRRRRAA